MKIYLTKNAFLAMCWNWQCLKHTFKKIMYIEFLKQTQIWFYALLFLDSSKEEQHLNFVIVLPNGIF